MYRRGRGSAARRRRRVDGRADARSCFLVFVFDKTRGDEDMVNKFNVL